MAKRLCYNWVTGEREECRETTGRGKSRGTTIPLNRLCNGNCPLTQVEFIELVDLLQSLINTLIPIGPSPTFITPTINDIIVGWPIVYGPDISWNGSELVYKGTPTGWTLVNITNQTVVWELGDDIYYQIEFESTAGCLHLVLGASGQIEQLGPDYFLRVIGGGVAFGDVGNVVFDAALRGCVPSDINCGGTAPTFALTNPITFSGDIPVGVSIVDLGGPLYTVNDACCVFKGLTVDVPLIDAALSNDLQFITFTNYGAAYDGTVNIGLWTSCGYQEDFLELDFPGCPYTLTFVNDHYNIVIPDTTGLNFLRAADAYTFSDPTGCCVGDIVGSVDNPDIDVTFDGTNYTFTYTGSDYGTVFAGELTFTTGCGDSFTAPLTLVFLDGACTGAITPVVSDLNVAYNSGNPFTVPLNGSTVINVTTLYTFTDPCCGGEAALLNVNLGSYTTPGISVTPIINDGTVNITLTSDGTVVVGVQNAELRAVSPCGTEIIDLAYQIV